MSLEVIEVKHGFKALSLIVPAAILAATLGSCAAAPPPGVVYVDVAPPPLRVESRIVSPGPGYVWVPGYWSWSGADYVWTPGVWMQPPEPRVKWVAPQWRRTSRGWYRIDGRWR